MAINLGVKVEDSITHFTGVATARTQHLHGCVKVCVEAPAGADGKLNEQWFDELRLEADYVPERKLEYPLGVELEDKLTGFTGTAVSRTCDLNGSVRIGLLSRTVRYRGEPVMIWVDEQRIVPGSAVVAGGPGPIPTEKAIPR